MTVRFGCTNCDRGSNDLLKTEKNPVENVRAIVCGDFNGGPECGAVRFLEDGFVDSDFLEDGEAVSSNKKTLSFSSPMTDAIAYGRGDGESPPPTMVVAELISQMVQTGSNGYEDPKLSDNIVERLTRIYNGYTTTKSDGGDTVMSTADVEKWLIKINGRLCRGDEYREAAKQMGWKVPEEAKDLPNDKIKKLVTLPDNSFLSLEGFIAVYQRELGGGKFWSIAHDLAVLGEPLSMDAGLFTARYDRMYCSGALQPVAVLDFPCDTSCPNESEPSDHLPVAATFCAR